MSWRRQLARFKALFPGGNPTEELDEEIRTHLEFEIDGNLAARMSQQEAREAALRAFGNLVRTKEDSRDIWIYRWLEDLARDVRFGFRLLLKSPGFTIVAVLTLGLGIGATTAVFTLANLIVRHPVALPGLDALVSISEVVPSTEEKGISPANYLDLERDSSTFESLAAYGFSTAVLAEREKSEVLVGVRVSGSFFATLGIRPIMGRTFRAEENLPSADKVLIISDALWKHNFGGSSEVIGKKIILNQQPFTVIGVMPTMGTFPLGAPMFWTPLRLGNAESSERNFLALQAVGRLRSGVSLEKARAEMKTRWKNLLREYPTSNKGRQLRVVTLLDDIVRDYNRQFVILLLAVVGFVLLIGCANVANLQLARGTGRQREVALRASLGATRGRILSQLLTETVVLAIVGGVAGLLVAYGGLRILQASLPLEVRNFCDPTVLRIDRASLCFSFVTTLVAGLIAGLAPGWQQTRGDFHNAIKEGGARVAGGRAHSLRRLLVVSELALALVLLIGAGLMVRGFERLLSTSLSLDPDSLLTVQIILPPERYPEGYQTTRFYDELLSKVQSIENVQSAALASGLPYSFYDDHAVIQVQCQEPAGPNMDQSPTVMPESISAGYFRTMHVPLLQGREFDEHDTNGSAPVAVVSESMSRRFWPGQDPLGKTFRVDIPGLASSNCTVVGVVGDTVHEIYDRSFRSVVYFPYHQVPLRSMDFVLRTRVGSLNVLADLRQQIHELDSAVPFDHLETMTQKIANQANGLRYVARLMAVFAGIALSLAAVGVYGVMSYSVNERRQEIGIRMALGAQNSDVLLLVMKSGLWLTLFGISIGVALALALARLAGSLIYGVNSWDLTAFTIVPALLGIIALVANYFPARRAMQVDPMVALRCE